MKIYEECYQPVSTLDLTWENSGSLYWLKVEEYFLFVRGLLAEAVWSDWWPQLSPDTSKCFNKIYTLGGGERGGRTKTKRLWSAYLYLCQAADRSVCDGPVRRPHTQSLCRPPSSSLPGDTGDHKIEISSCDLFRASTWKRYKISQHPGYCFVYT